MTSYVMTKEHRQNISIALKGRVRSKKHCQNISNAKKGHKMSAETRAKMSDFWKKKWKDEDWKAKIVAQRKARGISDAQRKAMVAGIRMNPRRFTIKQKIEASLRHKKFWKDNPDKRKMIGDLHRGQKLSTEHQEKLTFKGRKHTNATKNKIGKAHRGKVQSEATKEKLRQYVGSKASGWMGGLSYEPYTEEFNSLLKRKIRRRDKKECFVCGVDRCANRRKLTVHHIDYDKLNNQPINLVTLCNSCHGLTNHNRMLWEKTLKYLMGEYYGI